MASSYSSIQASYYSTQRIIISRAKKIIAQSKIPQLKTNFIYVLHNNLITHHLLASLFMAMTLILPLTSVPNSIPSSGFSLYHPSHAACLAGALYSVWFHSSWSILIGSAYSENSVAEISTQTDTLMRLSLLREVSSIRFSHFTR